jgi:hypothetical protein
MPDYLIVGSMRSGTSALYEYLVRHPHVARSTSEEIHYFTLNYHRGLKWYRGHFPTRFRRGYVRHRYGAQLVTGEATPYYMAHPHAPGRIAELLPEVKLIVVLRNPIDRAYSHYNYLRRVGVEPLASFEEALEAEPERLAGEVDKMLIDPSYKSRNHWHFSYITRGLYADQVESLFRLFPHGRVLVLQSEQLLSDPARSHAEALRHLGLELITLPQYPRHNAMRYPSMNLDTRRWLAARFEEPNHRLYQLLDKDLGWDRAMVTH